MHVRHEAEFRGHRRQPSGVSEIDAVKRWVRGYAVPIANQVAEVDELAIHDQAVDFRMGNAKRLDQVLDRLALAEGARERPETPRSRQEIVQGAVEAKERVH